MQMWLDEIVSRGDLPFCGVLVGSKSGPSCHHFTKPVCERQELDEKTLVRWYSMTKPIVTFGALVLCQDGVLGLDEPIGKWLPAFAGRKITIRHLMSHTAGLSYGHFPGLSKVEDLYAESNKRFSNDFVESAESIAQRLADLPLLFEPGTGWTYSYGIDLLGLIMEKATGLDLQQVLDKLVFEPLEMHDTRFVVDSMDQLAPLFSNKGENLSHQEFYVKKRNRDFETSRCGGSGLVGSTQDFGKFCECLLRRDILDKRFYDEMFRNQIKDDQTIGQVGGRSLPFPLVGPGNLENAKFGLGFRIDQEDELYSWLGYGGTSFFLDMKNQQYAIFVTQVITPLKGPAIWSEFFANVHMYYSK